MFIPLIKVLKALHGFTVCNPSPYEQDGIVKNDLRPRGNEN